jgi:hypothetical protein
MRWSSNLSDISKAERQIVAGVNYRLDVVVKRSGSARKARIVVFKDLKSHYKLTAGSGSINDNGSVFDQPFKQ